MLRGMKRLACLGVLFCGTAAADPMVEDNVPAPPVQQPHGASLDVGTSIGRVEPMSGTVLTDEAVRISPHIAINHIFYIGGEFGIGRLSGNGPSQADSLPIKGPGSGLPDPNAGMVVPLAGTAATVEAVVGARGFAGIFSGGVELAAGARSVHLEDAGDSGTTLLWSTIYDARARVDVWPTPRLSVGATAELGFEDRNDVSLGLVVGFHMMPYDAAR